jgi:glycosyltransferase involved in cell wall biosynthesis
MKRILFIHHLPPPFHGPALVGEFIRQSSMINSSFECRYINLSISASVDDLGQNSLRKFFRYMNLIWQVKKQLISFRPDFCHMSPMTHGPGFYKDALIITIVKLFGKRTVFHFHNNGIRTRHNRFIDDLLYRFAFRNTKVILLSKLLFPDVQKYVPEDRVYYCPNGIPEGGGHRAQGSGHGAQGTGLRAQSSGLRAQGTGLRAQSSGLRARGTGTAEILFLSHLVESKGVYVLADALKLLKDRNIAFHCTMIGGGGDISEAELKVRVEEKGLSDILDVAGKKYGEEKNKAFEQADIFVHPTYLDCMPLVLLEAMQHSLPVVSTFEGAIPDVVEDTVTGFLVRKKDTEPLTDKLEILIRNPEMRISMGKAGRAKYEREFTLERFERRMVEILEEAGSCRRY